MFSFPVRVRGGKPINALIKVPVLPSFFSCDTLDTHNHHKGIDRRQFNWRKELNDTVNNPSHYNQGEIECIDAIRAALTKEEFDGFCKGNIFKYTWRERQNKGDVDLAKARKYLDYLLEERQGKNG